jgi:hypothetical protein
MVYFLFRFIESQFSGTMLSYKGLGSTVIFLSLPFHYRTDGVIHAGNVEGISVLHMWRPRHMIVTAMILWYDPLSVDYRSHLHQR